MKFAAFIMTYERPQILAATIEKLLQQSLPPQKICIIDNSESNTTKELIEGLNNNTLEYIRMGYNAGPAGAAKKGLQLLAHDFDWIYWVDDDDPPRNNQVIEQLLHLASVLPNVGGIGSIGGHFNRYTGRTTNLRNRELGKVCEVDHVPGGKNLIINSSVVRKGILPTEELFFGFEELDYCLKIKKAGYKIYVDGEAWLKARIVAGNNNPNYRWRGTGSIKVINHRNYYSARNMLFILSKNRLYIALAYTIIKTLLKSVSGFRYGIACGFKSIKVYSLALIHFIFNKMGKVEKNF